MSFEYTCKKVAPGKDYMCEAEVYFRNGDYFSIARGEIVDLQVEYYDTLVSVKRGFVPFAKSGYFKIKLGEKQKRDYSFLMYDSKEFKRSRREYLTRRCVDEGGAFYFEFRDENNWSRSFYADSIATVDGDHLVFTFLENKTMGSSGSDYHNVKIRELRRGALSDVTLDFENCDSIKLFPEEIKELCLNFKDELVDIAGEYSRKVEDGYMRIKFDKDYLSCHNIDNIFNSGKKLSIKKLEERIVGKRGEDNVDICNLYVTYARGGCSNELEERISLPELDYVETDPKVKIITPEIREKMDEILENDPDNDLEEYQDYCEAPFISGCAKRDKDGSILIVFGKTL